MIRKLIATIVCCLIIPASASAINSAAGLLIETPQLTTAGLFIEVDHRGYGGFISITGMTEYSKGISSKAYTNEVFSLGIVKSFKHILFEIHSGSHRTLWQESYTARVLIDGNGKYGMDAKDDPGEGNGGYEYRQFYKYHQRFDMIMGLGIMVKTGDKHGLCIFGKVNYNFYTDMVFIGIGLGFQVRTVNSE